VGPLTAPEPERPLADPLEKSPQGTEAEVQNTIWHSASEAVVDIHHNRANLIRQKITLGEMRSQGVQLLQRF
jgi:hypothetical protein